MAARGRIYEDFKPSSEWVKEPRADILLLHLPGFRKDQLHVQLSASRVLHIKGERPLGGNKWQRFHEQVSVPATYETREITAKFEDEILYITQPKSIVPDEQQYQQQPAPPAPAAATPTPPTPSVPKPAAAIPPTPAPPQKTQEKKEEDVEEKKEEVKETAQGERRQQDKRKELVAEQNLDKGMSTELIKSGISRSLILYVVLALALALFVAYMKNYACNTGGDGHDL